MPTKPPLHRPQPRAKARPKRPSSTRRGYGARWRKIRAAFLAEHPICERCGANATEAHHVVPKVLGGKDEPSNLQALCKPCHSRISVSSIQRLRRRGTGACPVELVCGPPGAGKTTYVLERLAAGDLVVDVDRLFVALSGLEDYDKPEDLLPAVLAARDAVVCAVAAGIAPARKLWIIAGGATESDRRKALGPIEHAELTFLCPSADECYRRIANDPRRARHAHRWRRLIREWFTKFRRDRG